MCTPVAIAAVGIATTVISTKMKMSAQKSEAAAIADDANVAAGNARSRAALQASTAESKVALLRDRNEQAQGRAKAQLAAGNISSTSGSGADILASSEVATQQDIDTVRSNAALQAWGFRSEAEQLDLRADRARKAGVLGALGTGIGGAGVAIGQGLTALGSSK